MLTLAVTPQVDFALESSAAVVAGERLVARVFARMGDQVGRLAEGFPADRALVRLFTCVQSSVIISILVIMGATCTGRLLFIAITYFKL